MTGTTMIRNHAIPPRPFDLYSDDIPHVRPPSLPAPALTSTTSRLPKCCLSSRNKPLTGVCGPAPWVVDPLTRFDPRQ